MVSSKSLSINVSKTKYIVFRNRNMHFDPNSCNISIGNEILERIGNDCVNKYFKFVGLKLDEFLTGIFKLNISRIKLLAQSLLCLKLRISYH